MNQRQQTAFFNNEDAPRINKCYVIPYYYNNEFKPQAYLEKDLETNLLKPLSSQITEQDSSIIQTCVRVIQGKASLFTYTENKEVRSYIFNNEGVDKIFERLLVNDLSLTYVSNQTLYLWYHLNESEINQNAQFFDVSLLRLEMNNLITPELEEMLQQTYQLLLERIDQIIIEKISRKTDIICMHFNDEVNYIYLFMSSYFGQLTKNGLEKWTFFNATENQFPSQLDLLSAYVIILPGSPCSVNQTNFQWIDKSKEMIKDIYHNYPMIKIIGGCFGSQLIAVSLGGKVEKMTLESQMPMIIGRQAITLNEEFLRQDFTKNLLEQYESQENLQIVIQEAHNDEVTLLPEGATLLASSQSCKVEVFCIQNRALGFQSHPDFNAYLLGVFLKEMLDIKFLDEEAYKAALIQTFKDDIGVEKRNFMFKMIYEFIYNNN